MNILIIGASGFVGRHALALAQQQGHHVIGTQSQPRSRELTTFNVLNDRIKDCLPPTFLSADESAYGIICLSVRQIDQCYRERESTRRINVDGTITLIEDLLTLGITPVFISTSYVFSGDDGSYTETDTPSPICEYGRHKAEVEGYLQMKHPDVLVLRLDKIVGDNPSEDHLFSEWARWIDEGKPLTCIRDQLICPTLVDDIGRAILTGCEHDLKGIYNTANPEVFSREALAALFLDIAGSSASIVSKDQSEFSFEDGRPLNTTLDSSRFIAATGMTFTPMREVIGRFCERRMIG